MVIQFSRAQRRHDNQRMLEKVKRKDWWFAWEKDYVESNWHKFYRKQRDNLAICSCQSCCNVRHSLWTKGKEMLTFPERNQVIALKEGLDEYFSSS